VRMANRYAIAGFACVALAMIGAVLLVADVVLDSPAAAIVASLAAAGALWSWYLQPLRRRQHLYRRYELARTDHPRVRSIAPTLDAGAARPQAERST
jgi:hypothetical protein